MAITLRSGTPKLPQAIAFDCYRTLFDNSHDDWKTTFNEIIKTQKLPLTAEEFWTRWRKYEVNFRNIRTDLGRPFNSPPLNLTDKPGPSALSRYSKISVSMQMQPQQVIVLLYI